MKYVSAVLVLIGIISVFALAGCGSGTSESGEHNVGSEAGEGGEESGEGSIDSESGESREEPGGRDVGSEAGEHNVGSEAGEGGEKSGEGSIDSESGEGGEESGGYDVGSESGEHGEDGGEEGEGGEESGAELAAGEVFDEVRAGVRLVISYDPTANAFLGAVTNTTGGMLGRVRVEVHLSNGVELGPTTPVDLAPGQSVDVVLPSTSQPFISWSAHPEVG